MAMSRQSPYRQLSSSSGVPRGSPVFLASALLAGAVILAVAGCTSEDSPPPKNVLIFLVDTLRADRLGVYGYERDTSPRLDAFASQAVVFDRAFSVSPWTRTSVVSMFTSMYPGAHGVQDREDVADESLVMMPEVFRANGYATAAFVTNVAVAESFGMNQGFRDFNYFEPFQWARENPAKLFPGYVPVEAVIPEVISWLKQIGNRPFFLYVHTTDPHWRYMPPPAYTRWGEVDASDRYDGEVRYTDEHFGHLIDYLRRSGKLDDTVVVFTADHGEEFMEHGDTGHGHTLYNELLQVPLIVRHPAFKAGRRAEKVRLIAMLPTLAEVLGLEIPAGTTIQGRSLRSLLQGAEDPQPDEQYVLSEVRYKSKMEGNSLQRDGWKLIWTKQAPPSPAFPQGRREKWELYHVSEDPRETRDRAADELSRLSSMQRELLDRRQAVRRARPAHRVNGERRLDPRSEESLRSLGYIN